MSVGNNLRILRERKSLSQKELAELVGVTTGTIAEWESNETEPSFSDAAKLCKALEIPTDMLILNDLEQTASAELDKDKIDVQNKTKKKKKLVWIMAAAVCLLAVIAVALVLGGNTEKPESPDRKELASFSENTAAIEMADASVVKVYCYNYFGELEATGSGFVAFDGQTIVTNYHVMTSAYTCEIVTNQDVAYEVSEITCLSEKQDIAILRLEKDTKLHPLTFGDSTTVKKGEAVVAIGSPLGIQNTVSTGVLSGRVTEDNLEVLQFTAPISNGSSGGALFNNSGNVIGITYASYIDGQNLNLAIPIEYAEELWSNRGVPKKISAIYVKEHAYVLQLDAPEHIPFVILDELKKNPEKYANKTIRMYAYLSSQKVFSSETWEKQIWYLAEAEDVTYSYEYDSSIDKPSVTEFKKNPIIRCECSEDYLNSIDTSVQPGEKIEIIAEFEFHKKGDPLPALGWLYDEDTVYLNAIAIRKIG